MQEPSPSKTPGTHRPSDQIDRLGATHLGGSSTFFRVWAPRSESVRVVFTRKNGTPSFSLQRDDEGYFAGLCHEAPAGVDYLYELSSGARRPDPASAFQPFGVHRESRVIDHRCFDWRDDGWRGVPTNELIIYELHLGTFTRDGTLASARSALPHLLDLGVNAVELMPVAQTPGRWNWGYDGVGLFAVNHNYGTPDDLKAFVDACHAVDLSVILDVVYNHLGPEGNYLGDFGPYFSRKHKTPWGEAWNFDGRRSKPVRKYVIDNALRWLEEFRIDGLRLDASHFILDDSADHLLADLRRCVANSDALSQRHVHLIAESNVLDRDLLAPENPATPSFDAIWCDDLMHTIYSFLVPELRLTDRTYSGISDLARVLETGHLYEYVGRHKIKRSGADATPPDIEKLVVALQTHDSVGNQPRGERFHHLTDSRSQKAAAAIILLYPAIPLLFMGEEHASTANFRFFVDFEDPGLRKRVDVGRASEYPRHEWKGALSPSDPKAFHSANCNDRSTSDESVYTWYQSLITLRKQLKSSDLLRQDIMNVVVKEDDGVICISYALGRDRQLHVVSRLGPKTCDSNIVDEPCPIGLRDGAKLLLDSDAAANGSQVESSPDMIRLNQAVVLAHGFDDSFFSCFSL